MLHVHQVLQMHQELNPTWHMGLSTALQVCLAQVTGSYWMGGRSGLSFRGV